MINFDILLSGFIGAFTGGLLSFWGSLSGARIAGEAASRLEQQRHQKLTNSRKRRFLRRLLLEMRINIKLLEEHQDRILKTKLHNDVWKDFSENMLLLEDKVSSDLVRVYAAIHKYNELLEYERLDFPSTARGMGTHISGQANVVSSYLKNLEPKIKSLVFIESKLEIID